MKYRLIDGQTFDVGNPAAMSINPYVIAHGLALTNRYNGHTPVPYSVAEHSVRVALVAKRHAFAGLLHDAPEALGLGDIIGPVKPRLGDVAEIEGRLADAVCLRFGLPAGALDHPEVKRADRLVYHAEQYLLRGHLPHAGDATPEALCEHREALRLTPRLTPWSWQEARRAWLVMLAVLAPHLKINVDWAPGQEVNADWCGGG